MKQKNGFVSIILLVIVTLVILYYLHIPLSKILDSGITKKIAYYTKDLVKQLWTDFILLFQFIKGILAGNK